ncbi:D-alanine--D-alanine ligase [Buchnera aphidicola (Rhopalosiphum padi)]|uniref:D-alanine--D-alanine ligase n=2 Tax=Buchnera aphidicola TaxID=9 RepID=A0A4D6YJR6_BUCRP|nr:D-alanine--D-alanine ligase [Buchnera aphidicola]ABZ89692.1 D-alanine--D-alanine ligase [Buchnera aphidicola]QCI24865.1 D-alanine--D-alanine ligase [Buchnera aphidicola (Rhopalosiphum padi)]
MKKIAVLLGGNSSERQISIKSGYAILESLLRSGLNAYPVDTRDFPIIQLKKQGFDSAYIALHGKGGEDGSIQGVLEYLNIPYTGSGIMSSAISLDKWRTKLLWKSSSLPVLPDVYLKKKDISQYTYPSILKKILQLKFPVVIKPNNSGSSIGITIVHYQDLLIDSINAAFNYSSDIIIEKFIEGREYTVSILNKKILPPVKIITKNHFYDYRAKYIESSTEYLCPSELHHQKEKELKNIAETAWRTLGCKGCGRIDVILDNKNKFWLLEVNTIPGMTYRSLVPISAKSIGISFDELVLKILKINK